MTKPKVLPETDSSICIFPLKAFFGKGILLSRKVISKSISYIFIIDLGPHALMARLLILIAAPSHILFLFILRIFEDHFEFTFPFLALYLLAALIQITFLLYLCYCMVHFMWKLGVDPDNSSIPFLTALADFIGACLLAGAFFILLSLNDPNTKTNIPSMNITIELVNETNSALSYKISRDFLMEIL